MMLRFLNAVKNSPLQGEGSIVPCNCQPRKSRRSRVQWFETLADSIKIELIHSRFIELFYIASPLPSALLIPSFLKKSDQN